MVTNFFSRCVLAMLLMACSLHASFAQVFWTETFSEPDSATMYWMNGGSNEGTQIWEWSNDPSVATFGNPDFSAPTASNGFFLFNSDNNGEDNNHNVMLTGPFIDCASSTNTRISFWTQYMYYKAPVAALEVSIDEGATWITHTLFEDLNPEVMFNGNYSIDIPEANGQPYVKIRFRWAGNWEYAWKVDDIQLENVVTSFCQQNPNAILCDNLDAFNTALPLGPQSDWWTTWLLLGTEGGPNEGTVSTEQSSTAPNSVKIVSTSPGGGLQNAILQLGGMESGQYEMKFKLFIPANKTAYYDMRQAVPIIMGGNNLNVYFDSTGTGKLRNSGSAELASFSFPHGEWFECKHIFDLDQDLQTFYINGTAVKTSPFTGWLGGVLFMGSNAVSVFYIDDVALSPYEAPVLTVDDCGGAVDLSAFLGGTEGEPQTTGIFDNTNATADPSDPAAPACFLDGIPNAVPTINGSLWFSLTGDGDTYHIETVPCNATNYIGDGDTQMAIFSGECGAFTELACNEDLAGAVDYRAGIDIATEAGTNYHLLVDGWSAPAGGYVATGEFCIELTRMHIVSCAEGAVGAPTTDNHGFVCHGDEIATLFDLNEAGFVLPNVGSVHGMSWAVTTKPVPNGMWPVSLMEDYWGSYEVLSDLFTPSLINNGDFLEQNKLWYFTPVVVADAIDANLMTPPYLHDLDIFDACYFVGESVGIFFLGELAPLAAATSVTPYTAGSNDGAIDLTVTGGGLDVLQNPATSYMVQWSGPNSFSSGDEDISGLLPGVYTATIIDATNCVEPLEITVEVTATSGSKDPARVQLLTVNPNPTTGITSINLKLNNSADIRIDILNALGQHLKTIQAGQQQSLDQQVDLSGFANGNYFLRVTMDQETAIRRVSLQR